MQRRVAEQARVRRVAFSVRETGAIDETESWVQGLFARFVCKAASTEAEVCRGRGSTIGIVKTLTGIVDQGANSGHTLVDRARESIQITIGPVWRIRVRRTNRTCARAQRVEIAVCLSYQTDDSRVEELVQGAFFGESVANLGGIADSNRISAEGPLRKNEITWTQRRRTCTSLLYVADSARIATHHSADLEDVRRASVVYPRTLFFQVADSS